MKIELDVPPFADHEWYKPLPGDEGKKWSAIVPIKPQRFVEDLKEILEVQRRALADTVEEDLALPPSHQRIAEAPTSERMICPRKFRKKAQKTETKEQERGTEFKLVPFSEYESYALLIGNDYIKRLLINQKDSFRVYRNQKGAHKVKCVNENVIDAYVVKEIRSRFSEIRLHAFYKSCSKWYVPSAGMEQRQKQNAYLDEIRVSLFHSHSPESFGGIKKLCDTCQTELTKAFAKKRKVKNRPDIPSAQSYLALTAKGKTPTDAETKNWKTRKGLQAETRGRIETILNRGAPSSRDRTVTRLLDSIPTVSGIADNSSEDVATAIDRIRDALLEIEYKKRGGFKDTLRARNRRMAKLEN